MTYWKDALKEIELGPHPRQAKKAVKPTPLRAWQVARGATRETASLGIVAREVARKLCIRGDREAIFLGTSHCGKYAYFRIRGQESVYSLEWPPA